MKKRVISAFLCTVMAVSLLTGCGSDEKKSADNKGSKDGNYEEFITVDVYDELPIIREYKAAGLQNRKKINLIWN